MMWFGIEKTINSHFRWMIDAFAWIRKGGWLSISPPSSKLQVLIHRSPWKSISVRTSSFYDWSTIYQVFHNLEYETQAFAQELNIQKYWSSLEPKTPKLILDIGANIGISVVFYSVTYPDSTVVAIEPSSQNIELLKKNVEPYKKVSFLQAAIGPVDGTVKLFDPGIGNNGFRTFGQIGDVLEDVDVVSINSLLEAYKEYIPFLVKIDVEGAEKELFSANLDWIDSFKVIVVETHDWMLPGESISSNLLKALGGRSRDLIFRGENLFSIRND